MKTTICLALLLLCGAATRMAEAQVFLESEPGFAEIGALAEPLDVASLENAALLASGVGLEGLARYKSELGRILDGLSSEAGMAEDPAARAEAALGYLHKTAMRAYREEATTLDGLLDSGYFNCVSSAVLYVIAVRSLGIEAAGVRTSDHAFSTVQVGGRSVDVETTNPFGFDPGGKKQFKDSFGKVTGFAYVAPGGYGDRRAIGARDLAGLILSNRASALERRGRFAEAARLGADYAALCPGPDSSSFQADRINNLVADLEARRDYTGAEAAAQAAARALPKEAKLLALARTASYNRAAALAGSGDWSAAFDASLNLQAVSPGDRAVLSLVSDSLSGLARSYARDGDYEAARRAVAARAARAGREAAAAAASVVGEMELVHAANALAFPAASAAADRILAAGEVSPSRYAQALSAIYGNEAGRLGSGGSWLQGAALAEQGAAKAAKAGAGDGGLLRLSRDLRHNFVAEAHNRFARLYNGRDYAGAKAAIEAALAQGGATLSTELAQDLAAAEAAIKDEARP